MSMLDLTDLLLPLLLLAAPQTPAAPAKAPAVMEAPKLPPFAGEIVNFDRRGDRVVACVNAAAAPAKPGMPKPAPQADAPAPPPRYRIWVLEREIMQELLTTGGLCDPSWAPDGKSFAAAGARGVFTFSEPHFEPRALVAGRQQPAGTEEKGGRVYADPVWSPGGDRLAFRVTGDGADRVEVVDVKSAEVVLRRDVRARSLRWVDAKTVAADDTRLSVP